MTPEAREDGGESLAGAWIESFRREVSRIQAEAPCPERVVHGVVDVAVAMLDLAGKQMAQALASRDVIGQAKGVLMERRKIGPDEAFQLLKRTSQRRHVRIRVLAEEVAASVMGDGTSLDPQFGRDTSPG